MRSRVCRRARRLRYDTSHLPRDNIEVEAGLELGRQLLVLEVLVQAVVAAIEEALVADRPRERVGTNALIADMAELDVLIGKVHCRSPYAIGMFSVDMDVKAQA